MVLCGSADFCSLKKISAAADFDIFEKLWNFEGPQNLQYQVLLLLNLALHLVLA
jgi:hypothetical protein